MRNAALDIGSNSILLYIDENGKGIYDAGEITKLGVELSQTKKLSEKSMKDSLNVIKKFVEVCKENNVENIYAIGTMALRSATNSADFIKTVKNETGISIEIISGENEARLAYIAASKTINNDDSVKMVIDIGGCSTEFICGKGQQILRSESLDLGILKVSNDIILRQSLNENDYTEVEYNLEKSLHNLKMPDFDYLIGVGGSITNLASVKLGLESYNAEKINEMRLEKKDIKLLLTLFGLMTQSERENIKGLQKGRASTIIGGAAISLAVLNKFNKNYFTVSVYGLRHGLIMDKLKMK